MNLAYDVFVNDPPPQDGFLPNGEPKRFSPMASTLIYGNRDAVLMILWVSARAIYGVREHPGENPAQITLNSWL